MAPETHRIALQLDTPVRPGRLFQALLSPDDLRRWFCPITRVDPFKGGQFLFFGEESIASIYSEGDGGGPILGLEPGASLWYVWPLAGVDTDVVFYVSPLEGGGSRLQLVHQGMPAGLLLMDHWHLRLLDLLAYLEGSGGPGFFDYRPRPLGEVAAQVLIAAPPSRVFKALIDSDQVGRWMSGAPQIEPRVGGMYDLGWRDAEGYVAGAQEILALEDDRRLSYRWQMGAEQGAGHTVSWSLAREGAHTRVSVRHVGFSTDRDNRDYAQGWLHLAWALKLFVERGASPVTVVEGSWSL